MKKIMAFTMSAALGLSLCSPALAADSGAVWSEQSLEVNGSYIYCEKYNIGGSNYFKLRDLAYLLNNTGSQFQVGYDEASATVSITTGEAYTPNGTELAVGRDKSDTAVPSAQSILINGELRDDLTVYNIGGSNFFKLRDLGTALGFAVDYDAENNTAIVLSPWYTLYLTSKDTYTYSDGHVETYVATYDEAGNTLTSAYTGGEEDENTFTTYTYDADGNCTSVITEGGESYQSTMTYDAEGRMLTDSYRYGEESGSTEYTYDARGNILKEVSVNSSATSEYVYTYDDQDRVLTESSTYTDEDGTYTYSRSYVYDASGNALEESYAYDGSAGKTVNSYDADGNLIRSVNSDDDGSQSEQTYTYDADGNLLEEVYTSTYSDGSTYKAVTTCTYDADGNLLEEVTEDSDGDVWRNSYTYDAQGNQLSASHTSPWSSDSSVSTYDAQGHVLTNEYSSTYDGETYSSSASYTYDANGNLIRYTSSDTDSDGETTSYTCETEYIAIRITNELPA